MNHRKVRLCLAVSMLCLAGSVYSQSSPSFFLTFSRHQSAIFQSQNSFLNGDNGSEQRISQCAGYKGELGWQTRNASAENQLLHYPAFGFGYTSFRFPQTDELGSPFALYSFLDAPFIRTEKFALKYMFRLGLSLNWKAEHPVLNPNNSVIGSARNLYINSGILLEYNVFRNTTLNLDLGSSHFSNGHRSSPNRGVNLLTGSVGVRYHFQDYQSLAARSIGEILEFDDRNELYFTFGTGVREQTFGYFELDKKVAFVNKNYRFYNLSVALQRQTGYLLKWGGGIDLMSNGAANARLEQLPNGAWRKLEVPQSEKLQLGLFGSLEWVMKDFSILIQPGYRVIDQEKIRKVTRFYQHLGIKYHVQDFIIGMGIRSVNFSESEYVELNLGYRLFWYGK
ncbi:acyloxyacyl hydrolase [Marinoscillum luteum]|uniref:Acyloxyacyl hydrolase n=1 Tax=Marinoscillum luteum TaxID=861051 RepID=A0ABW7NCQ7_9BACT